MKVSEILERSVWEILGMFGDIEKHIIALVCNNLFSSVYIYMIHFLSPFCEVPKVL